MFTAGCMVIGLKKLFYESNKTGPGGEFFDEQETAVRRKVTAIEIYFNLLIAFNLTFAEE